MSAAAVVIGSAELLPALVSRAGLGESALTFSDAEPLQALQAITDRQPRLVVLERLFAATSRGAALINRLKSDPSLPELEIRVLSHTGDYLRIIARPAPAIVGASAAAGGGSSSESSARRSEPERPLDWRGTRREPRYRARPGVEIQLDGNPVTLIDVSIIGAQVLSPAALRPDQRVRLTVPRDEGPLRFRGMVAWARFELPKAGERRGPHYRAGVEFLDADRELMDAFCQEHQA
jgi:hypothetical protein